MNKWLLVGIAVSLLIAIPATAFAVSNWNCCIEPSCTECANDVLGCDCELREKLGMEVCGECSAAGCGQHEEMQGPHEQSTKGGCDHEN
ncbi:MAG TPA: hypothetical protein VJ110_01745 [Candidatus Nanoarchaeia archaeon]|nr:hypothetical protein [Candidatus Nanoarchaeia archaeon]